MVVRGNTRITKVFIICQSLHMNSELALNGISLQHRMGNHLVTGLVVQYSALQHKRV